MQAISFCMWLTATVVQVAQEVLGVLKFMEYVYDIFGMSFKLMLSTRPESVRRTPFPSSLRRCK